MRVHPSQTQVFLLLSAVAAVAAVEPLIVALKDKRVHPERLVRSF
jgi:hypothetical protein